MSQTFPDVPSDHPHAKGIEWAAGQGLVKGKADGTFAPEDPVTRGQLATILWRQAGSPVEEPPSPPPPPSDSGYPQVPSSFRSATPDNWQQVVASGANVVFEDGVYSGTLKPAAGGQVFMARNRGKAVFDGRGQASPFVNGGPDGVKLYGLTVREWMRVDTWKHGLDAVIDGGGTSGWTVGWCDLGHTDTRLMEWSGGWHVHDTYFHHADEYAIHGGGRNGQKLMERCTWEWVGKLPDRESKANSNRGGCKFALTSNITIRDHTVRHAWNGVWWDISNQNGVLENFVIEDCERTGVNLEICYGPFEVRNGIIRRCGDVKRNSEGANWPVPAGVLISLTPDSTVEGVTVEDSRNGITAIQWDHPNKNPDWSRLGLENIRVSDCHARNIAEYAFGYNGGQQAGTRPTDVRFTDCTYDSGLLHRGDFVNVRKV